jgi:Putative prokaryotic signal transducing protein
MTTVATFTTPEEAHLFRLFLESEGVEAIVFDEHFVQLFWHYSNAIGGVRVAVDESDQEAASAIFHRYMIALRTGDYPLHPVRWWPIAAIASLMMGIPLLLFGRRGSR